MSDKYAISPIIEVRKQNSAAKSNRLVQAISPDKQALLPGQTATFANYTSYSRGINGIMVDIDGPVETPRAADFEFKVGNDNNPDGPGWSDAPDPASVSVQSGTGVGDPDRATIIWNDNAIQNQWLQVTVLADNLGLAQDDVFYYGNAIGESGNSITDSGVNAIDVLLARNKPQNLADPATIDSRYDFNRDQRINAADMLIARNNQTHFFTALKQITVSDIKQSSSYDTVLRQGVRLESANREVLSVKADWLYELELTDSPERTSKQDNLEKEAVDELLLAY